MSAIVKMAMYTMSPYAHVGNPSMYEEIPFANKRGNSPKVNEPAKIVPMPETHSTMRRARSRAIEPIKFSLRAMVIMRNIAKP